MKEHALAMSGWWDGMNHETVAVNLDELIAEHHLANPETYELVLEFGDDDEPSADATVEFF